MDEMVCRVMKTHQGYHPLYNITSWYQLFYAMNRHWILKGVGCLYFMTASLVLDGCATSGPPTQEMSDARQALEAARQVDAASHAPETLQDAQSLLSQAEEKLSEGAFKQAQHDALAAKEEATKARTMALAISEAKVALQEADTVDALSGEALELLQQAEAAALIDDDKAVVHLARDAKKRAERDINHALLDRTQTLLGEAHTLIDEIRTVQPGKEAKGNPQHAHQGEILAIEEAYQREEGKVAYASAQRLVKELRETKRPQPVVIVPPLPSPPQIAPVVIPSQVIIKTAHYTVQRGDSLWKIAGRPEAYANPWRWRTIFKANRQHIKNANVIYPDQVLMMPGIGD